MSKNFVKIFEDLNESIFCKNNQKNCVLIESKEYEQYTKSEICGNTKSIYNIIKKENSYLFSTKQNSYSLTFEFSKRIKISSYMIEASINTIGTTCYWGYPSEWSLEGSNSQNHLWEKID